MFSKKRAATGGEIWSASRYIVNNNISYKVMSSFLDRIQENIADEISREFIRD